MGDNRDIFNVWERIGINILIILLCNSWQRGHVKLIFFLQLAGKEI